MVTEGTGGTATTATTSYIYDNRNQLTARETQVGNDVTEETVYSYDDRGNQTEITKIAYVNGIAQTPQVTEQSFDLFDRLIATALSEGTLIENSYNGLNQN